MYINIYTITLHYKILQNSTALFLHLSDVNGNNDSFLKGYNLNSEYRVALKQLHQIKITWPIKTT